MKLRILLVAAAILVASPAFAQKIYIDYDKDYDLEKVKTFAWAETSETSVEKGDPLMHSRIVNGIEHYLTAGGIREVTPDQDPDVYVTYHTSTKEQVSLNTTSFGYGYPGGWGGWGYGGYYGGGVGMGSSSTTVSTWDIGTLIVDIWDPDTNKLVWRGSAGNITLSDNPSKMQKKLDKALQKMVNAWDKIKAKEAKG